MSTKLAWVFILPFLLSGCTQKVGELSKPRTIITTDGEIDDVDSFIRMLLYANEFKIEGLVYSSSMWHYKGDGEGTPFVSEMEMTRNIYGERTELRWPGVTWMQELIDEYEKVYPNLIKHDDGFPSADYLRNLVTVGNIDFEGEMEKETAGSEFIKAKLLDDNDEPLYLQVWGGTNTIARALKSIDDNHRRTNEWADIYNKVCNKTIIYTILDQDATYKKYISRAWPDIKVYYNSNQFWCFAYPWQRAVPEEWHYYLSGAYMGPHIINNHGPLLKKYYAYGDGQYQEGDPEHIHGDPEKLDSAQWGSFDQYAFISEGDSPAYFHLIDVGLENLENPEYGGWGGRLIQSDSISNRWEDGEKAEDYNPFSGTMDATYPQTRWIKVLQQDFASRADWCIMEYEQANHPPEVKLMHANLISAEPGEEITLHGNASDPDGNELSYTWWQYFEVDRYNGKLEINGASSPSCSFVIPDDFTKGDDIHLILEVTDNAEHPMTRYQRVIISPDQ